MMSIYNIKKGPCWIRLLVSLMGLFVFTGMVTAQDTQSIRTRISLECTQLANQMIEIDATLLARLDRAYSPMAGSSIEFLAITDSSELSLGEATTNMLGHAVYKVDLKAVFVEIPNQLTFQAVFTGNDTLSQTDREMSLMRGEMTVAGREVDSLKNQIEVQLSQYTEEGLVPASGKEINLYVKRMVGDYRLGMEETSDEGKVVFDVSKKLPGGVSGILNLIVKLEEDDDLGTIRYGLEKPWGIPVEVIEEANLRNLWSPYPPYWLLGVFLAILAGIWFHYIAIFLELFKIKKLGKS